MVLSDCDIQKTYIILEINTEDEDLNAFLFSLGCYKDEKITLISKKSSGFTIVIKDSRYSIDKELAEVIVVKST